MFAKERYLELKYLLTVYLRNKYLYRLSKGVFMIFVLILIAVRVLKGICTVITNYAKYVKQFSWKIPASYP